MKCLQLQPHPKKQLILPTRAILAALLTLLCLNQLAQRASALAGSPWLTTSNPGLTNLTTLSSGQLPPQSINGNIDCTPQAYRTRASDPTSTLRGCMVTTGYGNVDSSNRYVQLNETSYAGFVLNGNGQYGPIPVPNSNTVISYLIGSNGLYLRFNKRFTDFVTAGIGSDANVTYTVNRPPVDRLKDRSGQELPVKYESMSFSANGKWMVADSPFTSLVAVNLETYEAIPFGASFNYNLGIDPGAQTAITDDGRYAVVTSKSFNTFKIYDLSTCGPVPSTITGPVSCQSRDLWGVMRSQLDNFSAASTVRFIDNESLGFYGVYGPSPVKISKFILSASGKSAAQLYYMAMGDSFAAGEGAYAYQLGTDTSQNKCHQSHNAYPYLLSNQLGLGNFRTIACSGAKMNDINNTKFEYYGNSQAKGLPSTLDDDNIYTNLLPGYRAQRNFVSKYQPKIVSLSVSGNDVGFASIINRCLSIDTCYGTYEERAELLNLINSKYGALVDTYTKIKNDSTDTKLYVIGYPKLVKPKGNCAANVHLNASETQLADDLVTSLNRVVKAAADSAGAGYVDVANALLGHRLCETFSSSIAVNGLTAGNDQVSFLGGPIGNESYHPNKLGHKLLKDEILLKTNNFGTAIVAPNPLLSLPSFDATLPMLDAAKIGRPLNKIIADPAVGFTPRGGQQSINVNGQSNSLVPRSSLRVVINSTPTDLGTYATDADGNLSQNVIIPASVEPGFHLLHIYGKNLAGEAVDIQKTVYVAANEADYDGDGLANAQDPCPTTEQSNVDIDKDGIDDACDDFVDEPPALISVPTPAVTAAKVFAAPLITAAGIRLPLVVQSAQLRVASQSPVQTEIRSSAAQVLGSQNFANTVTKDPKSAPSTAVVPIDKKPKYASYVIGIGLATTFTVSVLWWWLARGGY